MAMGRDSGLILVVRAGDVKDDSDALWLCGEYISPERWLAEADWLKERHVGTRAFELTYWRKYHRLADFVGARSGLKGCGVVDVELPQAEEILEYLIQEVRHIYDNDWDSDDYWETDARLQTYCHSIAALGWYIEFARRHPQSVSLKFYDSW